MLPQATAGKKQQPAGDCSGCDVLKEISFKIENLVACADKEEEDSQEPEAGDAEVTAEEGSGDNAEPGAECLSPVMYAMDLISVNELLDAEIKTLYNGLITAIEEDSRQKLFKTLQDYKSFRNTIDEIIYKLMSQTEEAKLRKLVTRGLGRVNAELNTKLKDCQTQCGPGPGGCDSCAADPLMLLGKCGIINHSSATQMMRKLKRSLFDLI